MTGEVIAVQPRRYNRERERYFDRRQYRRDRGPDDQDEVSRLLRDREYLPTNHWSRTIRSVTISTNSRKRRAAAKKRLRAAS